MSTGCMIGWYDSGGYSGLENMEERLETHFPLIRVYHKPDEWGTVKSTVGTAIDDGRLVMVSHKTPKVANAWIKLYNGDYDDDIDDLIDYYKSVAPAEVIVIYYHEPHGNSSEGSQGPVLGKPSDFVKAFRYFAKRFRAAGADNVKIGYCEIDSHADNYPNDSCYPGDDVVDVFCHDVYNWGGYPGFSSWKDPEELFAPFVADAKAAKKPLIFGEIGSHPTKSPSQDRGQWIRDMADYFKNDDDAAEYILGFCYYHVDAHDPDDPHYWRFAQGSTAGNDKDDFIDAISKDPYFLTEPIPVALREEAAGGADLGENHPSGGTPTFVRPKRWGKKDTTDGVSIGEISGLASSPKGGAWAIRDSGNGEVVHWMTQSSRGRLNNRAINVTGATNADWEDIVYVVEGGTPYLYIHDNRDGNSAGSNPKRLYKVPEPANPATATSVAVADTRYWKFPASASGSTCGSKQNCEAIIIFKGILYGIQKTDADEAEVYRIGAPGSLSTTNTMGGATEGTFVGTIAMHCPSGFALHHDGQTVLTFQHGEVKVFRGEGDTIQSLLTGKNTRVLHDPEGSVSFEGGDWYPYGSNDFLLIGEDKDTADYDATAGTAIGGGIPSKAAFGVASVALVSGAQTVTSVGAIPSPADYDPNEESAGLDFGLMTVEETGLILAVGIESSVAFGTLEATRDTGPGYLFTPPVRYFQPLVPAGARGPQRLFRYMDGIPTSVNIYVLIDGTVTEAQPWDQNLIERIYHGGHVIPIDDAEADVLASAGYAASLTPVTQPAGIHLATWGEYRNFTWGELRGYTWREIRNARPLR